MEIQTNQLIDKTTVVINKNDLQENKENNLPTKTEIEDWLVSYFADSLSIKPDKIDMTIPFDRYGLDSSDAVVMTGDLEDWLAGQEIDPTLMYDYPTIEVLAEYLSQSNRI